MKFAAVVSEAWSWLSPWTHLTSLPDFTWGETWLFHSRMDVEATEHVLSM